MVAWEPANLLFLVFILGAFTAGTLTVPPPARADKVVVGFYINDIQNIDLATAGVKPKSIPRPRSR